MNIDNTDRHDFDTAADLVEPVSETDQDLFFDFFPSGGYQLFKGVLCQKFAC